jgi:hypothetical protein
MTDKEKIENLTKEVISLRKQVDSLTPKLYRVKAWHKIIRNGVEVEDKSYVINVAHRCYSVQQAEEYIDNRASKSGCPGRSIYTSVEQIDFRPVENDWVNQLAKRMAIGSGF